METYQITLGGNATEDTVLGQRTGRGFSAEEIVPAIERLILAYLDLRESPEESFLQACRRLGLAPFKAALYEREIHAHAAE